MTPTLISRLRQIGKCEAISFLVLLGIAMPLKYIWGMPLAVRIVGMVHGVLFIAYCAVLWNTANSHGWHWRKSGVFFIAAFLPFGPFIVDGRLAEEDAAGTGAGE